MSELVSCIIIFLNEEKYLAEAIESVREQSYSNWELLLVDDGSTDGSASLARSYADREPQRIRYLTHPGRVNRGMSASRNLGLAKANGSLVGFLDGDDRWLPHKLWRQVELFKANASAIVVSGSTNYWHSWNEAAGTADRLVRVGELLGSDPPACALDQDQLHDASSLMTNLYPLGSGVPASMSNMLMRRKSALAVGGFEEAFRGLFEDQVFLAKIYLAGPFYVSSECFDLYRQHTESCCSTTRKQVARDLRRRFFRWWSSYLDRAGFEDRVIRSKIKRRSMILEYPRLFRLYAFLRGRRAAPE
jgi:glycosyltransferase involved in cell wall biosynthesis